MKQSYIPPVGSLWKLHAKQAKANGKGLLLRPHDDNLPMIIVDSSKTILVLSIEMNHKEISDAHRIKVLCSSSMVGFIMIGWWRTDNLLDRIL